MTPIGERKMAKQKESERKTEEKRLKEEARQAEKERKVRYLFEWFQHDFVSGTREAR